VLCRVAVALMLGGCATSARDRAGPERPRSAGGTVVRDAARADAPPAEPLARGTMERIDAPLGMPFVIPVDPVLLAEGRAPLRLLLDDGLELPSALYRVTIRPRDANPNDPWDRWLGTVWAWESAPISHADAAALAKSNDNTGFALLVAPKEGRKDTAVWVGGERVPMQWLPSLETIQLANPSLATAPWTSPLPAGARGQVQVTRAIAREAEGPLTRWRSLLLTTGLSPSAAPPAPIDDPLLEALARQQEHKVRVALARLWAFDRALAERVKLALAPVAMVAPGVWAPVWEDGPASTDRLILDLLSEHLQPQRRAQLAEQWLHERAQAAARVVDEGGSFSDDGDSPLPGVVVTTVNLSHAPATSWTGLNREQAPRDLRTIPPMECVVDLRVLTGAPGATHIVHTHVGDWKRSLVVRPVPVPATPPGLATGLFFPDLDARTLLTGDVGRPGDTGWETAAIIQRPARTESTAPEGRHWEVYVECLSPPDTDRSKETIQMFTGAYGAPAAAWKVSHDGSITSLRTQDAPALEELGSEVARAVVTDLPDRWIARIPLPPASVDDASLLRIGLTREDGRGQRTAWPRALGPWQTEPSRACVDLARWGD
jgi:hypothetical protein